MKIVFGCLVSSVVLRMENCNVRIQYSYEISETNRKTPCFRHMILGAGLKGRHPQIARVLTFSMMPYRSQQNFMNQINGYCGYSALCPGNVGPP